MDMQPALVGSEVEPGRPTDETSLSQRWLGLDWRRHLPWEVGGVTIEHGTFDQALPFIAEHYPAIFGPEDPRWLNEPLEGPKARFYREVDIFLVRDAGRTVGIHLGHPCDWSTYYVRSNALLAPYRGCGIIDTIIRGTTEILARHGIRRVEGHIALANAASLITWIRNGCVVSGMINTDRWGATVHLTKYLDEEAGGKFLDQFVSGTWPRCRATMSMGPGRRAS